jgi:hypothetical protein
MARVGSVGLQHRNLDGDARPGQIQGNIEMIGRQVTDDAVNRLPLFRIKDLLE